MGWIIALVSGALMSIQGVLNTGVTKQTSIWVSSGWVQLTALAACDHVVFYRKGTDLRALAGGTEIYAAGRHFGGFYHIYSN